jgi:hypothetical protein
MTWLLVSLVVGLVGALVVFALGRARAVEPPASSRPPSAPREEETRTRKRDLTTDARGALPSNLADMLVDDGLTPRARGKHYAFAHGLLRQAQRDHGKWLRIEAAARAGTLDELLATLWDDIPNEQGETYEGPPTARAIEGGVLVRMPNAVGLVEAHFVALVAHQGKVRYFTLEKSSAGHGVGEWTEDGHVSHGLVDDDEDAFLTALVRVLGPAT